MNMSELERIANAPGMFNGTERRSAFDWADKKRFDKRVSEPYRKRAEVAFFMIYKWAAEKSQGKS